MAVCGEKFAWRISNRFEALVTPPPRKKPASVDDKATRAAAEVIATVTAPASVPQTQTLISHATEAQVAAPVPVPPRESLISSSRRRYSHDESEDRPRSGVRCCLLTVLIGSLVAYILSQSGSSGGQMTQRVGWQANLARDLFINDASKDGDVEKGVQRKLESDLRDIKGIRNQLIAAMGGEDLYHSLPQLSNININADWPQIRFQEAPSSLFRAETPDGREIIGFKYIEASTGEPQLGFFFQRTLADPHFWFLVNYPKGMTTYTDFYSIRDFGMLIRRGAPNAQNATA